MVSVHFWAFAGLYHLLTYSTVPLFTIMASKDASPILPRPTLFWATPNSGTSRGLLVASAEVSAARFFTLFGRCNRYRKPKKPTPAVASHESALLLQTYLLCEIALSLTKIRSQLIASFAQFQSSLPPSPLVDLPFNNECPLV